MFKKAAMIMILAVLGFFWGCKKEATDAQALSIDEPTEVIIGETYQPKGTVKNAGTESISFTACFIINYEGEEVYSDEQDVIDLAPDDSQQLTFKDWTPEKVGDYEMMLVVDLTGDTDPANDTIAKELTVSTIISATYMIDASSYEDWAYFSFSKGDSVSISDPKNSLDWDLGFQRLKIRTNSGTSGPGSGGAKNMGVIDFDALTEASPEGYVVDTMVVYMPGSPHEDTVSMNPEMKDWFDMSGGMPPTVTSKKEVYVIKTADGRYAKLQILDYYDKEGHSGFITFRYTYQSDGSRSFK